MTRGWFPLIVTRGTAAAGTTLALFIGVPLTTELGPRVTHLAYSALSVFPDRISEWAGSTAVFILGTCAGLLGTSFLGATPKSHDGWEGWAVSLYYVAAAVGILLLNARRHAPEKSRPSRAGGPGRKPEGTLTPDLIPADVFFEQSREGIHILDASGKLRGANRYFGDMLGYSDDELKNLHVWDWEARLAREEILENLRQASPAGATFETCFRRKDGSLIDVQVNGNRVDWNGQSLIYGVCRDISARKRAEAELRESERRFRLLVDQAGDGFFVADETGAFVDVNGMACDMLGWSREELLTLTVSDVAVGFDRQAVGELFARTSVGEPLTILGRSRRKDGSTFPVEVRIEPVRGTSKKLPHCDGARHHRPRGAAARTEAHQPALCHIDAQ